MPAVQELPTEILCAIFELSVSESTALVPGQIPLTEPQPSTATTGHTTSSSVSTATLAVSPAEFSNFCAIPSQKDILGQCIALSQVCIRWRDVAIDLQNLWTRIYLGHNAFVSKDYNDAKATEITSIFLSRSSQLPLFLEISFTLDDPPLPLSWIQKSRYEENIRRVLLPHIGRCLSLRLVSSDIIITSVLDVFLERNLSSSPNDIVYTPLCHLHLEQIVPTATRSNQPRPHGHGLPIFPPDLSIVAPHLTTLYVNSTHVAVFPRWCLHSLSLNCTFISYQNHFHVFMKTRITKLVLHRVTIPGGLPYVRRLTSQHTSSVTSLSLSELRCEGPEADHEDIYTLFFALSLYRTLEELELSGLSREAMIGLSVMLRASPVIIFDDLRTLSLRDVKIDTITTNGILTSFPSVNTVAVERVDGGSNLVYNIWQKRHAIWPQLSEILLDGEMVKRG